MSWVETWAKAAEACREKDQETKLATKRTLEWLGQRTWAVFLTQTFRRSFDPVEVQRRWFRSLAALLSPSGVMAACWAVEWHKDMKRSHVHALLSLNTTASLRIREPSSQKPLNSSCNSSSSAWVEFYRPIKEGLFRRDGISRLYPIDSSSSAALWYVMKYVLKSLSTEYPSTAYPQTSEECALTFIRDAKGRSVPTMIANRTRTKEPRPIDPRDTLWGLWERKDGFHVASDPLTEYYQGCMGLRERTHGKA